MHPTASPLEKYGSPPPKKPYKYRLKTAFSFHKTFTTFTTQKKKTKNISNHHFQAQNQINMGIRLPSMIHNVKHIIKGKSLNCRNQPDVPKGHVAIYVGEMQRKRFVVPISYLSHPSFQDLLNRAEEEFGFDPPMGCLTIPCREEAFIHLASRLQASS
ncbi:auxin-responsive protein SAUR21-like [Populus alba x Populus x berolinensis]|uniref:Auxin-responsive protein SAUR21-like n=2 Tax=Populus TaxID=3689 RepID=A0AAD6W895_9ROSI|nr:auxin-responsive protein SAUR21-like [Populus alba x Populus x berolinensis]